MSFNKSVGTKRTHLNSRLRFGGIPTPVDAAYVINIKAGMSPKDAAKKAQEETGLSAVSGQVMKSRGYGWQKIK